MSYFNGIKKGDRVWDFVYGYGVVIALNKGEFTVDFSDTSHMETYCCSGKRCYCNGCNQTLFWDKVEFNDLKRPKVRFKERKYSIDLELDKIYVTKEDDYNSSPSNGLYVNGLFRNNIEIAELALKQIKKFTKLLALRDQECPDSRGYTYKEGNANYIIKFMLPKEGKKGQWVVSYTKFYYFPDRVYFNTWRDAQKICDILNSEQFDLGEEK